MMIVTGEGRVYVTAVEEMGNMNKLPRRLDSNMK
jgi:hypothetical protein